MLGQVEHVLGDLHVLYPVEVLLLVAHLVGIAQQRAHEAVGQRLERYDVLAAGEHHAADCDHVHAADRLAYDCEGVVPHLPIGDYVVGPDEIAGIDVGLRQELVDVDRAG